MKVLKQVFRIANLDPNRGLWYSPGGNFTGEIHNEFSFCRSSALKMPYNEELASDWRSATGTALELLHWFNLEELKQLEKHNFFVAIYLASEVKEYVHKDPDAGFELPHLIFNKNSSSLLKLIDVEEFSKMI